MIYKFFQHRIKLLTQIISILSKKRLKQTIFLFLLLFISVFLEILSIGSIIPFVDSLLNLGRYSELAYLKDILNLLKIENENDIRFFLQLFLFFLYFCQLFLRFS